MGPVKERTNRASKLGSTLVAVTLVLATLAACAPRGSGHDWQYSGDAPAIVGGADAAGTEEFAKSVASIYDVATGAVCTSSVLTESILLTAAHCVDGRTDSLTVVFDTSIDARNPATRRIARIMTAPAWIARQLENADTGDIALVRLVGKAPDGYKPAAFLEDASALTDGMKILLAGYGYDDGIKETGIGRLRSAEATLKNAAFSKTEALVDQTSGTGACHGDSGGPAYVNLGGRLLLFAVTSRGVQDEKNDCTKYGAFTLIRPYRDWIEASIKDLSEPELEPEELPALMASAAGS